MRWTKPLPDPPYYLITPNWRQPVKLPDVTIPVGETFMLTREALNDKCADAELDGHRDWRVGEEMQIDFADFEEVRMKRKPRNIQRLIALDYDPSLNMYMIARAGKIGRLLYYRRRTYRWLHAAYYRLRWMAVDYRDKLRAVSKA